MTDSSHLTAGSGADFRDERRQLGLAKVEGGNLHICTWPHP